MYLDKLLLVCIGLVVRYGVSLWPHSGQGSPPLYGDYEAQRHWQEVTLNIPIKDWYVNTTDNDLLYWGLDYPPLTAYHSYLVGLVGKQLNSSYVELHTSRGMQTELHKLFMRLTVIVGDLVVLFPAVFMFSNKNYLTPVTLMAYPGLILIDHGHFQYNNISLGLFLAAVAFILRGRDLIASVLFVCALNYKQMELYHALPFFFYLLASCAQKRTYAAKISKLIKIGLIVVISFCVIWVPFILLGQESVLQVVLRIFPFSRGLFEDKVSNFWCALDVVIKLKQQMSVPELAKLCLGTTFTLSLPSNIHLLFSPSHKNFLLSLVNTSLVFFLFSFQVHEKSILLAAIPVALLTFCDLDDSLTTVVPWFLTISTFSMLPLLIKDGLLIPTISLSILYLTMAINLDQFTPVKDKYQKRTQSPVPVRPPTNFQTFLKICMFLSLVGCVVLTILSNVYPPPAKYPYLWPLAVSVYSAAHFILFGLYFHYLQFTCGGSYDTQKKIN
eukprot:GFUD01034110.1.p1 GENE.GFUD01034110.1~~GFUD01034110.1.p1  ORF type:complete len:499 (+),score=59.72 GFUD01034110.1:39-1535(+)